MDEGDSSKGIDPCYIMVRSGTGKVFTYSGE